MAVNPAFAAAADSALRMAHAAAFTDATAGDAAAPEINLKMVQAGGTATTTITPAAASR